MARRHYGPPPQRLILDSGAIIALSRGDQRVRAFLARALETTAPTEIPVAVLAETLRGGPRDTPIYRVLKAIGPSPPTTEAIGRTAGELLGRARSSSTVDALVVAQAVLGGGAQVLTGDPEDLEALSGEQPSVWVQALQNLPSA